MSDYEIVTRVIDTSGVKLAADGTAPGGSIAAALVPALRPMMPQSAQLSAIPGTNKLVLVDRYDNVRRITAAIEALKH